MGNCGFFVLAKFKQDARCKSLEKRAYTAQTSFLCTEDSHFILLEVIFKLESKGEKERSLSSWMLMLIVVVPKSTCLSRVPASASRILKGVSVP